MNIKINIFFITELLKRKKPIIINQRRNNMGKCKCGMSQKMPKCDKTCKKVAKQRSTPFKNSKGKSKKKKLSILNPYQILADFLSKDKEK